MGKIVLISGPIKSGKTTLAEDMAKASGLDRICYIATQANQFNDAGMQVRIDRHQTARPDSWTTLEAYQDLDLVLADPDFDGAILDDLTIWATNLFFDELAAYQGGVDPADFDARIDAFSKEDMAYFIDYMAGQMGRLLPALQASPADIWIVTNELGWSLTPATILGSLFVDIMGTLNKQVAQAADQVYLSIMGLQQRLK